MSSGADIKQVTKTLNGEHVAAMVKALKAANIPVKEGALGGFTVAIKHKVTGERRKPFQAVKIAEDKFLVTHDTELFEAKP